jgi:hypothetical protein
MRQLGVYPPELGALPHDALARWGISIENVAVTEENSETQVEEESSRGNVAIETVDAEDAPDPDSPAMLERAEIFDLTLSRYPDPEGRFSLLIPDGFTGSEIPIGSLFESPNGEMLIQVYSVPSVLEGTVMNEESLFGIFLSVNEVEPGPESQVSDEIPFALGGILSTGRDMTLVDEAGRIILKASSIFTENGDHRLYFIFATRGELIASENEQALNQVMLLMANSLRIR